MIHEKLLADLISIKSYSGEEALLRGFIGNWFGERGIDSFLQSENLVVHLEGRDRTKAFIFNSHMDTVTAGSEWTSDPWQAQKKGNKIIGLGVSDMKSGLASSMLLAEKIHKSGIPPVDMWFTYVVKEEVDGSGTENFAGWFQENGLLTKYRDLAAIFTEPNSLKEVEHGHRGNYFLLAEAAGASGHASRPNELKGELAIRKMVRFADRFQEAVASWQKEFPSEYFDPTITLGEMTSIIANTRAEKRIDAAGQEILTVIPGSPNKFPESCLATFDLRTIPGAHDLLFDRIVKLATENGVKVSQLYPPAPAGFTDPEERIVKIASTTNGKRKLTVSQASADLGSLTAKGIKAVIFGPGEKDQCHLPNEYCYPAQIPQAVGIYNNIVTAWAK